MRITPTYIFTKSDRELLNGLLQGGKTGVPVPHRGEKLCRAMAERGVIITPETLRQRMFWKTNDQPLWHCVYALLAQERPDELKQLFEGQPETQSKEVELVDC